MSDSRRTNIRGLLVMSLAAGLWACGACQKPAPSDAEFVDRRQKLLDESARTAFGHADYERAAELYARCLERAYLRDDSHAICDAAFNRAASLGRTRRYAEALEVLQEARAALTPAMQQRTMDVLTLETYLTYKRGDLEAAERLARRGLDTCQGPLDCGAFTVMSAMINCDRGDARGARALLEGTDIPASNPRLCAEAEWATGRIALRLEEHRRAAEAFDRAADQFRSSGFYVGMADAVASAGEAYEHIGEPATAANRFLRAGRSAALLGMPESGNWLRRAERLATDADLPRIAAEARARLDSVP